METGIPTFILESKEIDPGIPAAKLFVLCGLCQSMNEARNLIDQGGLSLDGLRIERYDVITRSDLEPGILRRGKKKHCRIIVQD